MPGSFCCSATPRWKGEKPCNDIDCIYCGNPEAKKDLDQVWQNLQHLNIQRSMSKTAFENLLNAFLVTLNCFLQKHRLSQVHTLDDDLRIMIRLKLKIEISDEVSQTLFFK